MNAAHLGAKDFEARYRDDLDPWSYLSSDYERRKYDATLAACGEGPFEHALELGASIGVFSARLAPRCGSLITIDAAPTAVAEARRRLAHLSHAQPTLGTIPQAIPDGPFNLVIASEILYYLEPDALAATLARLRSRIRPRGRLVTVHWRPEGPERPFTAAQVHEQLHLEPWLIHLDSAPTEDYLLDVWERR